MIEKKGPDHYRYVEVLKPDGVKVVAERYVVIGETTKCWYVIHHTMAGYAGQDWDFAKSMVKRHRKRILKDQGIGRRFCYADRRLAMHSLVMRKKRHLQRLKMATSCATLALKHALEVLEHEATELPNEINCGHDDYTGSLNFCDW